MDLMEDLDIPATVTGLLRADSSMAVMTAVTEEDEEITFALELRYAADIVEALHRGEDPYVEIAPWMVLGRREAP